MSGYLENQLVEVVAVRSPDGAVHGQMAKRFAVRSESRYRRKLIYVTAGSCDGPPSVSSVNKHCSVVFGRLFVKLGVALAITAIGPTVS